MCQLLHTYIGTCTPIGLTFPTISLQTLLININGIGDDDDDGASGGGGRGGGAIR